MQQVVGAGNDDIDHSYLERAGLQAVDAGDKLAYYRDKDGVQFVPKIRWEQLILN